MVPAGGYTQAQTARQWGIEAKRISHWVKRISHWVKQMQEHGTVERAFPGQGHEHDAELARLPRENFTVRLERDLLKKVALIFAEPPGAAKR